MRLINMLISLNELECLNNYMFVLIQNKKKNFYSGLMKIWMKMILLEKYLKKFQMKIGKKYK